MLLQFDLEDSNAITTAKFINNHLHYLTNAMHGLAVRKLLEYWLSYRSAFYSNINGHHRQKKNFWLPNDHSCHSLARDRPQSKSNFNPRLPVRFTSTLRKIQMLIENLRNTLKEKMESF